MAQPPKPGGCACIETGYRVGIGLLIGKHPLSAAGRGSCRKSRLYASTSGENTRYINATTAMPTIAQNFPVFHGVMSSTLASGISQSV